MTRGVSPAARGAHLRFARPGPSSVPGGPLRFPAARPSWEDKPGHEEGPTSACNPAPRGCGRFFGVELQSPLSEPPTQASEHLAQKGEVVPQPSEPFAQTGEPNPQTSEVQAQPSEDEAQTSEPAAQIGELPAQTSEDVPQTGEAPAQKSEEIAQTSEQTARRGQNPSQPCRKPSRQSERHGGLSGNRPAE